MALTPEEQAELDALEAEFGQAAPAKAAPAAPGLTPEEQAELQALEAEFGQKPNNTERSKAMLRQFEGFKEKAYKDTGGVVTVGYGRTGADVTPATKTTKEIEEQKLSQRLNETEIPFLKGEGLPDNPALVSIVYNLGRTGFKKSSLYPLAKEGRWEEFADKLQQFTRDKNGTVQPGLVKRRKEEAAVILSELAKPAAPAPVAMKAPVAPQKEKDVFEPFRTRKDVEALQKEMQQVVTPEEKKTLDEEALKQAQETMISGKAEEIRVLPSELTALARIHNVPVSSLEGWSSFLGTPEAKRRDFVGEAAEFAKYVGGTLSNMVGLGLPQKLAVETQANPKMRGALEDLRTLADAKRSGLVRAAEFVGGFKVASAGVKAAELAAKAAKLGTAATATAKAGAVAGELALGGAAQAESGKEVAGATTALLVGGGVLGSVKLASETVGLIGSAAAKTSRLLQKAKPKFLEEAATKAQEQFEGVDTILNTSVIRNTSVTGEDLKDAAKLAEKLGPQNVQQIAEHVQQTRPVMVEIVKENLARVGQDTPERVNQEVARWFTENSVRQVALETFGTKIPYRQGDVLQTIRTVLNKPEDAAAALNRMRVSQVVRSEVRRGNYQAMPEVASSLKRIGDVVTGSRYAAESIDRRHGTKIVPTLDAMSRKFNEFHAYLRPRAEEVSSLIKNTRAADLSTEDLYQKLDKGGKFGDEAKDAVLQSWRKFFSDAADDAGKLGVQIQKRQNYVPYAIKPQEELYTTLKNAADQFKTKHGIDLLNQDLTIEQIKEFKKMGGFESDLLRSLDILSGDPKVKNYQAKLLGVLNDSKTGAINRVISARALERTGEELPSLIKDQDVGRLAQRWLESTFKAGTMRDSIAELRTASQLMRTIGDKRANKYLNNLVADISGMPRDGGIGRELSQIKANVAANLADKAMNATGAEKLVYSGIQKITDAMPLMYNSMYSNALGYSPKQALANISALATQTIPELGYAFGTKLASKSLLNVLNDITFGREIIVKSPAVAKKLGVEVGSTVKTSSMRRWLENEGLASSQWNENIERAITNSMKKTWKGQIADSAIAAYGKLGMALFEATESVYRVMAADMAKQINKAIIKGDAEAGKFLDSLPRSYRKLIDGAKDEAASEKLLTDYIIGKTVYNYNQASASEIGRSLGPILSSFTKWPTEQLGDAVNTFAKNGVTAGAADFLYRRMAPLGALIMLDHLTGWREDPETALLVTGKRGMQQWAPIQSLASVFSGEVAPPIVSIPAKVAKSVITADPQEAAKATTDAAKLFIPGAKLVNMITDALETF